MRAVGCLSLILGLLLAITAVGWYAYNEIEDDRAGYEARIAIEEMQLVISRAENERIAAETADVKRGNTVDVIPMREADLKALLKDEQGGQARDVQAQDENEETVSTFMPYVTIDGSSYIGYLTFPELLMTLPVQAALDDMEQLKISPCRFAGSVATGDLVIAGHNYKRHFTPVKNLKRGAIVIFEDIMGEKTTYAVTDIEDIAGDDTETMLSGSENWDLTLFTCSYGGKSRVTLRCKIVVKEGIPMPDPEKFVDTPPSGN